MKPHPAARRSVLGATLLALAAGGLGGTALAADERGTREEAQAMMQRAAALWRAHGRDKALAELARKDGPFFRRDLYVTVGTFEPERVLVHPNPRMVGKSLVDVVDSDGKPFGKEIGALARGPGTGWVEYKWPEPVTREPRTKAGYVERLDANHWGMVSAFR